MHACTCIGDLPGESGGGGVAGCARRGTAGAHLVAGHDELEEPDLGGLLPEHEAADLGAALRGGGGDRLVAEVELGRAHPHLPAAPPAAPPARPSPRCTAG